MYRYLDYVAYVMFGFLSIFLLYTGISFINIDIIASSILLFTGALMLSLTLLSVIENEKICNIYRKV